MGTENWKERIEEIFPMLKEWLEGNYYKLIPSLELYDSFDEFLQAVDNAKNKGKSLITPLGTLDRLEILRNVPERVR